LGSQYWARFPHVQRYNARFGILLDMVGGKGATFYKEYYSNQFAKEINKRVWEAAARLGYGRYFINEDAGGVTDDHLYVNKIARIKTIDIIPHSEQFDFAPAWHTVKDDMDSIDKSTLKAVGQTILEVIYNEE
jgi:hypothetical protein